MTDGAGPSGGLDVLQVNKLYYPATGGIEEVVRTVAEGLAERGHRSRVLASVPRGRGGRTRHRGVDVAKAASLGTVSSVPLAPAFPVRLATAARDADVVHHHLPNPLGAVSQLAAPTGDAATVATYHSDIVRQRRALRAYEPLLRTFLERVDRILVTSPRLLEHSEHLGPVREKCTVVPLAVDPAEYDPDREPAADLPVPDDRPTLLFVGRLNYYKGVEHLVDAMAGLDAHLLVAGDGERREALQRRARERGVAGKVSFLGYVPEGRLRDCYAAADVFVLPSVYRSEAFGVVQLEAMAHALPVVNTDLPTGVPWVSQDGETGLTVPPGDAAALADAIEELLADPERRRALGRNGRARVEREFAVATMLDRVEGVYRELTA